jgi:D-alanine-D-alanine ligase
MSQIPRQIAVIFGGRSVEHDVSVLTGLQFIEAMNPEKFAARPVYVDEAGDWWTGDALLKRSFYPLDAAGKKALTPVYLSVGRQGGARLVKKTGGLMAGLGGREEEIPLDLVVPAIHGSNGEDGSLQGMLEFAGIPYSGAPALASAAAMDKAFTKTLLGGLGVPVLPHAIIPRPDEGQHLTPEDLEQALGELRETSGFPLFVKPQHLGSSIGIAEAPDMAALLAALLAIFRIDSAAIVEPLVPNLVEYNVAVAHIDGATRLSAIERPIVEGDTLDFAAKYMAGGNGPKLGSKLDAPSEGMVGQNRVIEPAELTDDQRQTIETSALAAFDALGLAGSARIDFLADSESGEIWFNEINTIPGSFAYYLWQAAEPPVSFTALTEAMIDEGFALAERRRGDTGAGAAGGAIFGRN